MHFYNRFECAARGFMSCQPHGDIVGKQKSLVIRHLKSGRLLDWDLGIPVVNATNHARYIRHVTISRICGQKLAFCRPQLGNLLYKWVPTNRAVILVTAVGDLLTKDNIPNRIAVHCHLFRSHRWLFYSKFNLHMLWNGTLYGVEDALSHRASRSWRHSNSVRLNGILSLEWNQRCPSIEEHVASGRTRLN